MDNENKNWLSLKTDTIEMSISVLIFVITIGLLGVLFYAGLFSGEISKTKLNKSFNENKIHYIDDWRIGDLKDPFVPINKLPIVTVCSIKGDYMSYSEGLNCKETETKSMSLKDFNKRHILVDIKTREYID